MKSEKDTKCAARARYNQCRRSLKDLDALLVYDPNELGGTNLAEMRASVEDLTQCFHEFNAYWNVYAGGDHQDDMTRPKAADGVVLPGVQFPRPAPDWETINQAARTALEILAPLLFLKKPKPPLSRKHRDEQT